MTLIPYNNSTSRFNEVDNWSKILFNKDRKLQTTEFIEIQDIIENQLKNLNKNLYDFYNVVKGCKVILISINNQQDNKKTYNYLVTAGQVFIELDNISSYIDTPSFNFSINNEVSTYYLGIQFKVDLLKDDNSTRDPFSGGQSFGYLGADRIVVSASVNIYTNVTQDGGFYPLAIIKPITKEYLDSNALVKSLPPEIFYYKNSTLENQFSDTVLPVKVNKKLQEVLHEISGDFIDRGLDLSYSIIKGTTNSFYSINLKVDPGVVYLNGKRLVYNYVFTKEIDFSEDTKNILIYVYLDFKGEFVVKILSEQEISLFSPPQNSIEIGTLLINEERNLTLTTGRFVMPDTSDIVKLQLQHDKNKQDILDLSLQIDELLGVDRGSNLSGVLSDSFTSLKNSNSSHPLYNASIAPSIQAITLPFSVISKNKNTFSIFNEQDLIVKRKNNELYWSSVASTEEILVRNKAQTRSINVGVDKVQSANLEVSPNILFIENEVIKTSPVKKFITDKIGSSTTYTTVPNTRSTKVVSFLITSTGFASLEDNIELKIDSLNINSVSLLQGTTSGTSSGTYKANESGHIILKVEVEITTSNNILYIYLESSSTIASNQVQLVSLSSKRSAIREQSFSNCVQRSSSILSGVASTFNITNNFTIKGIQIILTEFNNSVTLNRSILDVYLTKTNFGLPTDEVLARGSLILTEGVPVLNSFVTVEFDRYVSLSSGEYALVFNTTYENLELGTSVNGENLVDTGLAGSYDLVTDKLYKYNKDTWEDTNEILSLNLLKSVPSKISNTTSIEVEDIEKFNAIEVNLPIELINSSTANLSINNNPLNNRVHFFEQAVNSTTLDIQTLGSQTSHPIIELDNLNINLFSYRTTGTWVSSNKEFARPYNFVEISFDIYNPPNSLFEVYFSSNQGQTWELLSERNLDNEYIYLEELKEVNKELPMYNYKFRIEDLTFVEFNNQTIERTQLMVRIDLSVESLENIPFFKNLIALTY